MKINTRKNVSDNNDVLVLLPHPQNPKLVGNDHEAFLVFQQFE